MKFTKLNQEIKEFNQTTHGSSDLHKDEIFVRSTGNEFAPFAYLKKRIEEIQSPEALLSDGFVYSSLDFFGVEHFHAWYEKQFARKLMHRQAKNITILERPNNKDVLDLVSKVHSCFEALRSERIILNGKNFPVQLGEWYARCIFGLNQRKSTSQRGFDFYLHDKKVEVKVHWADSNSPRGVKIRKSMVELSDYCIIMFLANNFMIREVCFLDSDFVLRKFSGKGHTLFLKDVDLSQYYFSKSAKQRDKVANSNALLKFATPSFAMVLAETFNKE